MTVQYLLKQIYFPPVTCHKRENVSIKDDNFSVLYFFVHSQWMAAENTCHETKVGLFYLVSKKNLELKKHLVNMWLIFSGIVDNFQFYLFFQVSSSAVSTDKLQRKERQTKKG